jgi:hypothetical protein
LPAPTTAQLEELAAGLPASALENFTTVVQPLLANHCATAGCHGVGAKSAFRLSKLPAGKSPTRRLTLHNLYAAWQQIDLKNPAGSPLLTLPLQPHGTSDAPIFTSRDLPKVQLLAEWTHQATRKARSAAPASLKAAAPLLQTPASLADGQHETDEQGRKTSAEPSHRRAVEESPAGQGESTAGEPADPFDPEVFNRRFHPQRSDSRPAVPEQAPPEEAPPSGE